MSKVVLSASGGMDSTVLLFAAAEQFDEVYVVSFDYGQRHLVELEYLEVQLKLAQEKYTSTLFTRLNLEVPFVKTISANSSLTNENIANPDVSKMAGDAQPASYVPFRNMMFLSMCCAYAETVGAGTVWYGATKVDSLAGVWDGDEYFIKNFNEVTSLNRMNQIKVEAPLIDKDKVDIIVWGSLLGVDFGKTITCYSGKQIADATTPSSSLRLKGFLDAGFMDPIEYLQQDKVVAAYSAKGCVRLTNSTYHW